MFLPVCPKRISSNLRFLLFFRRFTVMPFCLKRLFSRFFPTFLCGVLGFDSVSRVRVTHHLSRILFHPPSSTHTIYYTPFCHRPSFTHHRWSHTIFYTQLCHTLGAHTNFVTRNFVTHYLSHANFHTQLCHPLSLAHHLAHTFLSHTTLSHTIFHTQLCHTFSFLNPS